MLSRPFTLIRRLFGNAVFSSLTRRIVFFNLAALVVLVGGILYLNQFREGLIDARVESLLTQVLAVEGTMLAFGAQLLGIVYRPLTLLVVAVALLTLVQWFYRERWLVFQQKRGCLLLLGILVLAGFYPVLMDLDNLQVVPDSSGDALLHDAGQFD